MKDSQRPRTFNRCDEKRTQFIAERVGDWGPPPLITGQKRVNGVPKKWFPLAPAQAPQFTP